MSVADETFRFSEFTEISTYLWLCFPLLVIFIINYMVKEPSDDRSSSELSYTACTNPLCARCQLYQVLRKRANETIKKLINDENKHELRAITEALRQNEPDKESPQQPNVFFMPVLTAQPCWPPEKLTDENSLQLKKSIQALEDNFKVVLEEYNTVKNASELWTSNTAETGQWKTFYFYNQGKKIEDNCAMCPQVTAILESLSMFMRGCVFGNALFSVVDPGTMITEHYGPTNIRLRCHLGLSIPSGVTLTVNGIEQEWEEGKCLLFDDSFLHAVESHNAVKERVVLIVDLWHPDIKDIERKTLEMLFP